MQIDDDKAATNPENPVGEGAAPQDSAKASDGDNAAPAPTGVPGPAPTGPQPAPQTTQWGTPASQWSAPAGAPNVWPSPQPPAPAWGAGQSWQPQSSWQQNQPAHPYSGWNVPPAGYVSARRPSRVPTLLIGVAACLIAFSGGLVTDHAAFPAGTSSSQGPGTTAHPNASMEGSSLYNEALQIVKKNFVGASSITDQQLLYGSISGMVDSLGDTGHSEFLSAQEYAAMQSSLTANFAGIGVILSDDAGAYKVNRVLDGAPALAAGVKAGDLITAVDGKSTANMTFNQLETAIRGTAGTKVVVTVIHLGSTEPVDITITRAHVTVPLASWGMVPGTHVADISLAEFSDGAADQVQSDIDSARKAGASSIIFDLRGNPGGYADQAKEVASEFLSSGVVYIQQDAHGGNTRETVDPARAHTNLPLVVLVDHDSASSSEIVAGALQDSGRARIVGVNTFGTGTVLQPFPLSDGSVILLGTAWWLTPNGHRIFGVGITPNQTVQMPSTGSPTDPTALGTMTSTQFDASGDSQLLAAVADLNP